MKMEDLAAMYLSSMVMTIFMLFFLYLTFMSVKYLLKIRKVKIVNSLLEKGYEVLTYDKDGVPFYMKKGSIKKTIFEFNKQEKDAKA